jgi:hypothetical protein
MANQTTPRRGRGTESRESTSAATGSATGSIGDVSGLGATTETTGTGGGEPAPVREAAAAVGQEAREATASFADRMKERAAAQLDSQKVKARQSMGGVAQFVRQATEQLDQQGHQGFADYGRKAADRIEQFAARLEQKDLDEVLHDVERFARRQPAIFIGAAFGVGVIAGRFLRSSSPSRAHGDSGTSSYGSAGGGYTGPATYTTPGTPSPAPSWDAQQTVS